MDIKGERQPHVWHQGDVLPEDAIRHLQLNPANKGDYYIVVTHDCDLACETQKEPYVEIILAKIIPKYTSNAHAKNPRWLDLEYTGASQTIFQLHAPSKNKVEKKELFTFAPHPDFKLNPHNKTILQEWLSARYLRAAYPEAFEKQLRQIIPNEKRTVIHGLEEILHTDSEHILALLFDLDDGAALERKPEEPYQLGIYVLYSSYSDADLGEKQANRVSDEISQLMRKCYHQNGAWQGIKLKFCHGVSDEAMTVQQRQNLTIWRVEHLSFSDDQLPVLTKR